MARKKGSTNKNVSIEQVDPNAPKKKRGRQPGSPAPQREPAVIIPLGKNYRIKWDKLNKTLQEKSTNQQEKIENDIEETDENGWKNLGYFDNFKFLGKCFVEELVRKKAQKENKDAVIEIEQLIEIVEKTYKKVNSLFGQMDIDETRIKVKGEK